ncbi:MAG: hypothetical protein GX117_10580 [Candidatus Hydrogenedentes bacterium]|jgi:hypothetical protein|nr:hypothetical protein [Candidatus Hydrogenedentota bacterium]
MASMLFTLLIAFIFLGTVFALWILMQLWAEKRLGPRKQGCKGPVESGSGEYLCCKGDGSFCETSPRHFHEAVPHKE